MCVQACACEFRCTHSEARSAGSPGVGARVLEVKLGSLTPEPLLQSSSEISFILIGQFSFSDTKFSGTQRASYNQNSVVIVLGQHASTRASVP